MRIAVPLAEMKGFIFGFHRRALVPRK
jgi:hypothetical protein